MIMPQAVTKIRIALLLKSKMSKIYILKSNKIINSVKYNKRNREKSISIHNGKYDPTDSSILRK